MASLSLKTPPKRVLVIPLRFIGDTILTVPLIRNLRTHFPAAKISVLCSTVTAPLLQACPYVDDVMIEEKGFLSFLKQLQAKPYDLAVVLRKSVTMAMACRVAEVSTVVGYDKQRFFKPLHYKRWGLFLDASARYPSLNTETPQALHHLSLLRTLSLEPVDHHLELWTTPEDDAGLSEILAPYNLDPEKPIAVLHAISASHGKQIDAEKYSEVLRFGHAQGYQWLATGVSQDSHYYDELSRLAKIPLINLAGKTTLNEMVALYRRIQLLVSVDSSPLHIASAVGIPKVIGVFGPTNEKQWGVFNTKTHFVPVHKELPCRPCYAKVCSHNNCKETLSGKDILQGLIRCLTLPSKPLT